MRKKLLLALALFLLVPGVAWGEGDNNPSRIYVPYTVFTGPYTSAPATSGAIRYNTSLTPPAFQYYNGSAWGNLGVDGGLSTLSGIPVGNGAGTFTAATSGTNWPGTVINGVYTTDAGTVFQPPAGFTYVLDGDLTPVIPAGGSECRWFLGVDTNGTTYSGITAARAVNAPITGTPVAGQRWDLWIYDNGTAHNVTLNAAFVAAGVSLPSNIIASNGTVHKFVHLYGKYSKAQAAWMVEGITYQ